MVPNTRDETLIDSHITTRHLNRGLTHHLRDRVLKGPKDLHIGDTNGHRRRDPHRDSKDRQERADRVMRQVLTGKDQKRITHNSAGSCFQESTYGNLGKNDG